MKKLIGMLLAITIVLSWGINASAEVIQKGDKTYITLDKEEVKENKMVLNECFKIKKFKVTTTQNSYTIKYKTNKSAALSKKEIKEVANKLHGSNIEKRFKNFRTYKITVIGIDKQGKTHTTTLNGHKISK